MCTLNLLRFVSTLMDVLVHIFCDVLNVRLLLIIVFNCYFRLISGIRHDHISEHQQGFMIVTYDFWSIADSQYLPTYVIAWGPIWP